MTQCDLLDPAMPEAIATLDYGHYNLSLPLSASQYSMGFLFPAIGRALADTA